MQKPEMWDSKASDFYLSQLNDKSRLVDDVINLLKNKKILNPNYTVIDVGGGTGRYAIPLAKNSKHVTVSDFSKEMLKYAKVYANDNKLNNLNYVHENWKDKQIGNDEKYDVVFSSMSAATRELSGVDKMIESSKKYCVLNQFVKFSDTVIDLFKSVLNIKDAYDPHEDDAYVIKVVKMLFEKGFYPEVQIVSLQEEKNYDTDEVLKRYKGRFYTAFEEQQKNYEQTVLSLDTDGQIHMIKEVKLAVITWQIN